MRLKQQIGEYVYELQADKGAKNVEISIWAHESKGLQLVTDVDQFDLDKLSAFFLSASQEVERMNDLP